MTSQELKILVAEDQVVNQIVVSKLFKKMNLQVDLAKDGVEASAKGIETQYDLILMDVLMPGKDGLDATRDIRSKQGDHPVIIALTASVMDEDKEACIQAGMNDFMSKPIDLNQIVGALNKWFGGVVPPKVAN